MASDVAGVTDEGPAAEATLVPPVIGREVFAVAIWTLMSDLLIFRTLGYSGPALFFAAAPVAFLIGCPGLVSGPARKITIGLLVIVALRLAWAGSGLTVFSALVLVVALAMSAAGYVPYVLEGSVLASRAMVFGARRLSTYRLPGRWSSASPPRAIQLVTWLLPLAAGIVFAAIFVFANPDLFDWVSHRMTSLADQMHLWLRDVSIWELPFCVAALLIGVGLMRPGLPLQPIGPVESQQLGADVVVRSPLYAAFRNTLLMLIALFAVYLTFEFATLWKREFPEGFYYAGYAHQGAAWLTYALALATALLSVIFGGSMLRDDRLITLRRLAWIWSAQNMLLAAAVYNRLMIYVGYNGMTRMRTIGFFGITVVVIGFVLVLYKIGRERSFWWLVRAQLIALMLTVIGYSVFPVDYIVHRYNVAAVARGYLHPSVMIAVKPIRDEGIFPLIRLADCKDEIIRDGVRAILAQRHEELQQSSAPHWTEFQGSRVLLARRLDEGQSRWAEFRDHSARSAAIDRFREYAMRWY